MKRTRKALLLILCLCAAVLLSACHTDSDPWPAGGTDAAITQSQPSDGNEADVEEAEETQQPGGSDEPGLNG